jgi:Ca-activated chloride channel family protein
MMTAIKAALEPSDDQSHIRIVCFMTDGYVGNDMEIISEVQKHPNARVFSFGIGSSVNRFLLDKMAEAGRGEVEYVDLNDDGSAAARRFHERVRNPLLTDISIDWNNLPVADVYPQRIPDLFGAKPLILTGRFTSAGRGTIRLKGKMGGSDFVREIPVELPETMALHDVLAPLWARARVDNLMNDDYAGAQSGNMRADLKDTITQLGIEYRLMTQFTSFVAVEEMVVTDGGQPRRIDVPVEVPQGTKGDVDPEESIVNIPKAMPARGRASAKSRPLRISQGVLSSSVPMSVGGGAGGGVGGGSGAGSGPVRPSGTLSSTNSLPAQVSTRAVLVDQSVDKKESDELRPKLHHSLFAVVEKLRRKETLSAADEGGFIRNGKAEVQVWLSDKSQGSLAKLKELGFEVVLDAKSSKLIIGRLPVEKLEALAKLDFVKYVSPQITK